MQEQEKSKFQRYRKSSYLADMFLQQRSKVNWIKLGDDNTKYFSIVIKHRKLQRAIVQLADEENRVQTEPEAIANIFVRFYKDLLVKQEWNRTRAFTSFLEMGILYQWITN